MRHNSCCWKDLHQTCTQYSYPSLKGLSEHLFKAVTIMNLHYAWRVVSFSLVFLFFNPSNCFPFTTPPALLTFFSLDFFLFLQEIQMCRHCMGSMPCTSMQAVTHSKSSQMLCGGSPHHSIPQFRASTLLVQIARIG